MPITSIEPNRLYRRIAEQLRALIQRGEYAPGTRLPPERDLAAQLGGIAEAITQMETDAGEGRIPTTGDRLFHVRIAEAAGNGVLVSVVGQLFDGRSNPLFTKLAHYFENPKSWAAAIGEHRRVLDALAARDPEAARDAMRHHMQMSHKRFNAGWPEAKKHGGAKSR